MIKIKTGPYGLIEKIPLSLMKLESFLFRFVTLIEEV